MDRNTRIVKNSVIFAIGNFGSKVLVYVMVLVYTHYIEKSDLGYYDIVLATVNLIHPLVLMAFDEGIYRWLIGNDGNKEDIISSCFKTISITTCISIVIMFTVNFFYPLQYVGLIALLIAASMLYSMFLNTIRGLTKNKLYAFSGILNSVLLLAFELVSLIVLSMGIGGLILSKALADILTILFIYCKEPAFHGIIKRPVQKDLVVDVFKYSFPLVPNQVSWWIVNSSDRYIILGFLGKAFNGIYSISNKFPTIITTVTGIIYFALQETVIKEYDSDDRDKFYSSTFKNYYVLLFSLVCCAVPATKLVITWYVGADYTDAWKYVGFLYFGTIFNALSSFLGIGYQISRETKRSVLSTIFAAIINIAFNILFIRYIGLYAASISTFIAYLCLFIIRLVHSRKYFTLNINWMFFATLTVISCTVLAGSFFGGTIPNILLTLAAMILTCFLNKKILLKFLKRKGLK